MDIARELGLRVIPNYIIGLPGDDYEAPTRWLEKNVDMISVINVNWLAVHFGNGRGSLGPPGQLLEDPDQNFSTKSWLSHEEGVLGHAVVENLQRTTDGYRDGRPAEVLPPAEASVGKI